MIKVILKYLISLCCFLIIGQNGSLFANPYSTNINYLSIRNEASNKPVNFALAHNAENSFIKSTPLGNKGQSSELEVPFFENEENNEPASNKKHLKNSSYSAFLPHASEYHNNFGNIILSSKNLACPSSSRHLIFGGFRI